MPGPATTLDFLVDGHLDIAFNAIAWRRDPARPLAVLRAQEGAAGGVRGLATVTLDGLLAARVGLVFGTLFAQPSKVERPGQATPAAGLGAYRNEVEAEAIAWGQLRWYEELARRSPLVRLIRDRAALEAHLGDWSTGNRRVGVAMLMEGAEAIARPSDLPRWVAAGVRMIGLSWATTRYAGGTRFKWDGAAEDGPGDPLTPLGLELLAEMSKAGVALDVSHLSDEAFWPALDAFTGRVLASHCNARALCPGQRQLSDEMIQAVAGRGGVIGLALPNSMIVGGWKRGGLRPPLGAFARHAGHVARVAGGADRVALGTDLDGGFGRDEIPAGLDSAADLPAIGEALRAEGFGDREVAGVLGGNWVRFLREHLP